MEDEIKILRLVTGEDIICKYYKISVDSYLIADPMMLIVKFKGKDSTVIMEHWLPVEVIKSNETLINPRDVITMFDPNDALAEYYTNLVDKLHRTIERRKQIENLDIDEMIDIMEAIEESQGQILH
jgi:hypothetical protein